MRALQSIADEVRSDASLQQSGIWETDEASDQASPTLVLGLDGPSEAA